MLVISSIKNTTELGITCRPKNPGTDYSSSVRSTRTPYVSGVGVFEFLGVTKLFLEV